MTSGFDPRQTLFYLSCPWKIDIIFPLWMDVAALCLLKQNKTDDICKAVPCLHSILYRRARRHGVKTLPFHYIRCRWVVSFTLRPLYLWGKDWKGHKSGVGSELARGKRSCLFRKLNWIELNPGCLVPHQVTLSSGRLALPWLRRLLAYLSPQRPGFAPCSVHVWFVVDKVALGQVFLGSSVFPVIIIPPWVHTHIIWGGGIMGPFVLVVQRHVLTPSTWKT
jgi:hypothetical protein